MAEIVQVAGAVLVVASAVLAVSCVVAYQVLAKWWRSPMGRHLFSFMAVLAGGLTLWAVRVFSIGLLTQPEPGLWPYIRLGAFAAFDWVLAWRLFLIIRAQLAERRSKGAK